MITCSRARRTLYPVILAAIPAVGVSLPATLNAQSSAKRADLPGETAIALVGATLIDGNGGPAVPDVTIVVRGKRIAEIGPRASVTVPRGARVIDAAGKFATPGFIDTNVHISLYNNGESMVRYEDRFTDIVIETAQTILKQGSRPCATATVLWCRWSPCGTPSITASCSGHAS